MANMTTQEILQGIKDWAAPKVIYDISAAHNNTKYTDLADALGTDGGNIPQEYRKGGITVRYVQSNDNKYVQFRYMSSSTAAADFINVNNWQGVDTIPTPGSKNLTESGGVYNSIENRITKTDKGGFYVSDVDGNVAFKYDSNGLDAEKCSEHFIGNIFPPVQNKGFFITDKKGYVAAVIDETGTEFSTLKNRNNNEYSRHIYVAASNTNPSDKLLANFVCDGQNDEVEINQAIASLPYGGTVQLLDGDYYLDSFTNEGNSAIFFGYNEGRARVINLIGSTENKSYNTRYGVTIHVSETANNNMNANDQYRVIYGTSQIPSGQGYFDYTHINNVNIENMYIYLYNSQKKVIGIDCSNFGGSYIKQVGVYSQYYFRDRFEHLKPATPVEGCIGVITCRGSNDEMSRIGLDTVNVGGLYTGFWIKGTDHMVMETCSAARCCYGYHFSEITKTLTCINCCDEGNTHLPTFAAYGRITMIDFNIERINSAYIPDDPSGNTERHAVVGAPTAWQGFISYSMQDETFGMTTFFRTGDGDRFKVIDLHKNVNEQFQ